MNNYSFEKRLSETFDIPYGSSVLAAVSGGVDSMCMLHALCSAKLNLKIYVAHMNFNLRGEDSLADEHLVEQWCKERGVTFFVNSVNTLEYCKQKGISMEMGARELRYNWFDALIKEHKIEYLFTAHNANDNAETICINLLRGSGIKGLCAIGEYVKMDGYAVVRPLLAYSRREIEKYAQYFNVPYRVDKTNLECDVVRNKLRNLVFPIFEKINPSAVESINRSIKYVNSANNILLTLVDKVKGDLCIYKEDYLLKLYNIGADITGIIPVCSIDISKLEAGNEEFWLYSILSEYGFGGEVAEALNKTLHQKDVKRFASGEYVIIKERGYIKIYESGDLKDPQEVEISDITNNCVYKFGKTALKVEVIEPDDFNYSNMQIKEMASRGIMAFNLNKVANTLSVRGMKKGDSFAPYGMRGTKKISDYLTDLKVDNATREFIPLLCSNNKVVSVLGNRIDSGFAVAKGEAILLVSIISN